ncbi:GNAT family N-acetyltransferase [Roseovarius sp. EL26]|uniref:GNAT family N-acetyltransferase n=1 Tax=Roseovarius sp. EL26 TaxID=2126672 RepID=UPI000EA10C2B|nr:GNAT family N-acetyltransferase [Roseovarius sp. EL26]
MFIRAMTPSDAAVLVRIFHDSVRQVGIEAYSAEQVAVWSPAPATPEMFLQRVSDGRDVFVALDDGGQPCGFIELENNGHIDCFYCRPDVVGTGVGAALYETLEAKARQLDLTALSVEASERAKRFFLQRGYAVLCRQGLCRQAVELHHYRMQKVLEA